MSEEGQTPDPEFEGDDILRASFGSDNPNMGPEEWGAQKDLDIESLRKLAQGTVSHCFSEILEAHGLAELVLGDENDPDEVRVFGREDVQKVFDAINKGMIDDLGRYFEAAMGYCFQVGYTVAEKRQPSGSYRPDEETGEPSRSE